MEVSDPHFTVEDGQELGFTCDSYTSYRTDLTKSEDELFNAMESACRRCIRKAEKSGVTIEEAHDLAFADEYYEQLKTYSPSRNWSLLMMLSASGHWSRISSPQAGFY